MFRTPLRQVARVGYGALLALGVTQGPVAAQDVTEPALKAAYIYNFAKFTEWPADTPPGNTPFLFCVAGDAAVGDALIRSVKDRLLDGQPLTVSMLRPGQPLTKCRLLYISAMTSRQAEPLVAGVRDLPVLTISDLEGFSGLGGIASFFFESGQLRFSVNLAAARRAGIRISSRLLVIGKRQ